MNSDLFFHIADVIYLFFIWLVNSNYFNMSKNIFNSII